MARRLWVEAEQILAFIDRATGKPRLEPDGGSLQQVHPGLQASTGQAFTVLNKFSFEIF